MAQITGKFLADFESFYTAVEKANVSLDGFETNASTVERQLDRMTNAFSGTKIIQQATLATEAVKLLAEGESAVAGATKLTEAEQKKLNATLTEAIAKYTALGQEAPKEMIELQKATAGASKETEKLAKTATEAGPKGAAASWIKDFGTQVTSMAAGMISAQAVIGGFQAAFSALVSLVGSSIQSFAGAEAAAKKVNVALQDISQNTPRASAYMADLATQFQNTTKYSDDLINEMQALLIQVGQVMPSDMNAALTAATNLASGLGIDLEQATQKVAMAFAGNTEGLKEFGITIDDARLKAEGMPYVLDEISKRYGGQAAAELDTYAGKVQHLANTWDNVKESIGQAIVKSPIVEAALNSLDAAIGNTDVGVKDMDHGWSELARKFTLFGQDTTLSNGIRQLEDLTRTMNELNWTRKQFEEAPVSENVSIRLGTAADQARIQATVNDQLEQGAKAAKDKEKADKDAARASEQHASAVASLREQLTGDGMIKQADLYVEALRDVDDVSKLSKQTHQQIADALWKGIEAYRTQGREVPKIMADVYASVAKIPPPLMASIDAFANVGKVAIPTTESIIKPMKELTDSAAAYEAETRRQVDAWTKAQIEGKKYADTTEKAAQETEKATGMIVQLNAALGQNATAYDRAIAGANLLAAYAKAGIATSGSIGLGGYEFKQLQETGVPGGWGGVGWAQGTAPGAGTPWGTGAGATQTTNTLNVNVNNADAQGIANKLVTEMRHSGYRM